MRWFSKRSSRDVSSSTEHHVVAVLSSWLLKASSFLVMSCYDDSHQNGADSVQHMAYNNTAIRN